MSWLDKAISFISPKWGCKREAWQQARRAYEAADISRLNEDFLPSVGPAEFENGVSRQILRERARYLEQNSDVLHAILSAKQRNIIGDGFTLQARTPSERLNTQIETAWKRWCRARNCDVTGQQSLMQMLRMAITRKTIDGGILFVKKYTRTGMVPFALEMVEVDELDAGALPSQKANRVVNGIEYDKYNRPVGYWIRQFEADGNTPLEPVYVKAGDVIYYYTKHRPTQLREITDLAQTVLRIDALDAYVNAEQVKHKIMACLSVFVETDDPPNAFGQKSRNAKAKNGEYPDVSIVPGMVNFLKPGQKVQVINPTGQATDAASFVRMLLRLISSGQGISYEAVSRDLSGVNYSAARQGLIEDNLTFAEDIEHITDILDEIYETFVISCVLANHIRIGNFWDQKEKYLAHEWIRRPKPWIDPVKEANATKIALQSGIKTYKEVAAENGMDWRDQVDDIQEVLEYGEKTNVDIGALIYDGKLKLQSEPERTAGESPGGDGEGAGQAGGEDTEDTEQSGVAPVQQSTKTDVQSGRGNTAPNNAGLHNKGTGK